MLRRAALVLLAVLLVASCSHGDDKEHAAARTTSTSTSTSSSSTTTTPPRATVAAVGDSLLFQVQDALPKALPDFDVHAEGIVGLTSDDATYAVERLRAVNPVAAVVVLGTNDARRASDPDYDLAGIRRVARSLGDIPCVRWVTVNEHSRFPDMNKGAAVINEELRTQAKARPNFAVIPWDTEVVAHPDYLLDDGLHHTEKGQAVFVQWLADALRACVTSH